MKEIHAYQNKDGTYRLEIKYGSLPFATVKVSRARLSVDCLHEPSSERIMEVIVEGENKENQL